ncbi:MAG TPA: sigma-70 family RNA polymerase sigma factor [Acholeplasmataceae bacterium]|nr:sigma-70 family RNA polymerase sigma factor [Acholeplasmataceae bacterium]
MEYNDNELLYLIYEENEVAVSILFKKYISLIKNRLQRFNIKPENYEDFFQEGLMALHEALNIYNPFMNKSFNKFFDLILQRRIMNVLRREKKYFYGVKLVDNITYYVQEDYNTYYSIEYYSSLFEGFNKKVFQLRFVEGYKPRQIQKILKCDIKKVYNAIYYIRKKVRELQNND